MGPPISCRDTGGGGFIYSEKEGTLLKKVMKYINQAYDGFNKLNEWFIIALMSIMCLDLLAQVVFRYVFSTPLTWSEELARYLFVWIALFGSAWCGRGHIHVRMTAVVSKFPAPVVRVLQIAISIFCAAICFILFPHAIKIFTMQSKLKAVTLGVSLGIEYIAAPVGILMMAVQWTVDALFALFDWEGYQARYMKKEE